VDLECRGKKSVQGFQPAIVRIRFGFLWGLLSMYDWTDDAKLARALGVRQSTLAKSAAAFEQLISPDATEGVRS
jgi:hypothetical protein